MLSCTACGIDVSAIDEYPYMLRHELWVEIHNCKPWEGGRWCIGYLEDKMGRKLTHDDFDWTNPLNIMWPHFEGWSDRLKNRREN